VSIVHASRPASDWSAHEVATFRSDGRRMHTHADSSSKFTPPGRLVCFDVSFGSQSMHIIEQNALYNLPPPYGGRKNHYVFLIPYTLHYNLRHCTSTCHLSTPTCMAIKTPVQNGIETVMCIDQKLTVGIPSPLGDCSRCFSWSTWSGLPKKSGSVLQPQAKYPKFNPQTPKSG